jgi:predicted Zn finger-like uncharacterized protein
MSLITQCPACSTMFRVVPDQLRVSEGWVRCGQCDEVFDANAQLRSAEDVPAPDPIPKLTPEAEAEAEAAPEPEPQAEPVLDYAAVLELDPFLLDRPADPPAEPLRYVQADAPLPPAPAHTSVADLSFMRKRRKRSFWERRAGRSLLVLGSVVAAGALVLQLAVWERERIAAMQPALVPALAELCDVLGCKLVGLYQIESLMIDSSGFAKVRADTYRLNFSLRNAATLAVATPALELTLTDSQDQPALRRVLLASEFAPHQATLAAGAELNASVAVEVDLGGAGKFSGYRLLAFYP